MTLSRTFILRNPDVIDAMKSFIDSNALEMARQDKPLAVTVTEYKAKRKQEQNALYWVRLEEISSQAWIGGRQYSKEVWHEYFRGRYAMTETGPNGQALPKSTTKMSVSEFSDYLSQIEAEAAQEYGVRFSERMSA